MISKENGGKAALRAIIVSGPELTVHSSCFETSTARSIRA